MITIHPNLTSTSQNAFTLCDKSGFGEKKQGIIIYSVYETLYLIENKKAIGKIKLKKNEKNNYLVFRDLRKKGYIPKAGLKFGADFRVYVKNERHAKYLVHIVNEKDKIGFKEILTKTRISHSTAKKLLIAIIDSQEDITYLEVDWKKL
ncbi:MAG: tRNA-intron lyase [Candidatus Nanoarchaeia archaeon]|nr:tRNA-intron lyase [Candidatus Nanoarchaeia archaeon]MDD5741107.1 tRNA-intron lyase [Candidatus Nanoarchaeia archaeon]